MKVPGSSQKHWETGKNILAGLKGKKGKGTRLWNICCVAGQMNVNLWDSYLRKAARSKLSLESSAVSCLTLYRTRNRNSCSQLQGQCLHHSTHCTAIWSRLQKCWSKLLTYQSSACSKWCRIKLQLLCSLAAFRQEKYHLRFFQSAVQWVTTKLSAYVFFFYTNRPVDLFSLTYTLLLTVCNLRFCTTS